MTLQHLPPFKWILVPVNTDHVVINSSGAIGAGGANFGVAGQVLTSAGNATPPSWQTLPQELESGTRILFQQTAAPTGWTKDTTHNDKALRVVNGVASSGGSVAFSSAFVSQAVSGTVGNTTLTTTQIPAHAHNIQNWATAKGGSLARQGGMGNYTNATTLNANTTTDNTGGGGAHNHTFSGNAINLSVQYVDVIIATKN